MYELGKQFRFDASHTLERDIDTDASRRIHGHSYRAEVTLRGEPDPVSGMIIDLGVLEQKLAKVRAQLDHHLLDEVAGLGPATLENLCAWIWRSLAHQLSGLARVTIYRDSTGDTCTYFGPEPDGPLRAD
jgi:6-pyruvoyltetrahydropterin/6-carboxytetrahydropterin synthase